MYFAVVCLLFFATVSYAGQTRVNGLANVYGLLFSVILGFWFYSIFWQYFHSQQTMPYYPRWLYKPTIYVTLLTCAISTFTYIRVFGYKWIKLYKISRQVKFFERALYALYLISAILLCFIDDIYTVHLLLLGNFLAFCIFSLIITKICADNHVGKIYTFFFASLTAFFLLMGYVSYTGIVLEHPFLASISHIIVNWLILFFCFVGIRYGHKELTGFFHSHTVEQFAIVRDLPKALSEDELFVEYQPQINIHTGKAVGAEVLVRWQHPTRGKIPPNDFIALAESMEIIDYLTQWVIQRAITQAKRLQDNGTPIPVSINFSPLNFNFKMVYFLKRKLKEHDLPVNLITVEMTENLLLEKSSEVTDSLNKLHEMGVAVSIDDYGKGYSSLSYLRRMAIDELKIDRSFVTNIDTNKDNYEIVRSTIAMAQNLSIHIVAEGVEDEASQNILKSIGCETAQGFGIAKPMSPDALIDWVKERNA